VKDIFKCANFVGNSISRARGFAPARGCAPAVSVSFQSTQLFARALRGHPCARKYLSQKLANICRVLVYLKKLPNFGVARTPYVLQCNNFCGAGVFDVSRVWQLVRRSAVRCQESFISRFLAFFSEVTSFFFLTCGNFFRGQSDFESSHPVPRIRVGWKLTETACAQPRVLK